ncbi:uncharacterized protein MEPE_02264 [Melanopsichium pennsylvanicum]|uniref:Uncharacterized protein n=1 Tax=Melanopsichium pennsylvanicum TaxID=63383 RepID=A0AAJ4XJL0_9BASI|nr:uncharacterized protein MEPE_02264 [Melanopsichium pennsylvanicum]
MAGTYRLVLVLTLAALAVSRLCHAVDDFWEQLGDLPEVASLIREDWSGTNEFNAGHTMHELNPGQSSPRYAVNYAQGHLVRDAYGHQDPGQTIHELNPGQSMHAPPVPNSSPFIHPGYDTSAYLSGQHPGASSPSSVPYATTHTPSNKP